VTSLVIEDGGSEHEAIAGLLHDAAEDQGGEEMLATIGERFGPDVQRIVAACSDTFETPKPPWRERKEAYVAAIPGKAADEQRVSLADKVANARAILFDFRIVGDELWGRFNAGREGQLCYYRALADAFLANRPGPLADELDRTVSSIEAEAA
jgi:(p)ppGpp synthase/HD superfamily hydrolase